MIVVADTSPLNYLVLVGAVDVLSRLYREVYVPPPVMVELTRPQSPPAVRSWASSSPPWLIIRSPRNVRPSPGLHAGETAAIALAQELRADVILMDERLGRTRAREGGLTPVGTLGVLYAAAGKSLIDLPETIKTLTTKTTFHWNPELIADLLRKDAARRQR